MYRGVLRPTRCCRATGSEVAEVHHDASESAVRSSPTRGGEGPSAGSRRIERIGLTFDPHERREARLARVLETTSGARSARCVVSLGLLVVSPSLPEPRQSTTSAAGSYVMKQVLAGEIAMRSNGR